MILVNVSPSLPGVCTLMAGVRWFAIERVFFEVVIVFIDTKWEKCFGLVSFRCFSQFPSSFWDLYSLLCDRRSVHAVANLQMNRSFRTTDPDRFLYPYIPEDLTRHRTKRGHLLPLSTRNHISSPTFRRSSDRTEPCLGMGSSRFLESPKGTFAGKFSSLRMINLDELM